MKKLLVMLVFAIMFAAVAYAADKCALCGMKVDEGKRQYFVITTKDGKKQKTCSQGCTGLIIENIKKDVKYIEAVDYNSGALIDAHSAFYVRGSDIKPVMGGYSLLAFPRKEDAEKFQKEHGGKVVTAEDIFSGDGHMHSH